MPEEVYMHFTKQGTILVSLLVLVVSFASCQKYPSDIVDTMNIVEKIQGSFYYDNQWMAENRDKIYHPEYNFLALHLRYNNLHVDWSDLSGEIVYSKFRVLGVNRITEELRIGNSDSPKQSIEMVVVKVSYLALANIVNDQEYIVYKEPKELIWYYLLVKDNADGKYKIYDELPSFKVGFVEEILFKDNVTQYTQGKKILEMIESISK